jgi:hypothetical protein
MADLPDIPEADDQRADSLHRGRLEHYRAVRWWHRRLVRLMGIAPAVAWARIIEQTEAGAHARTDSEHVRLWLMMTARVAVDDEEDGSAVDLDGNPFDPGGLRWRAYLEQRGLKDPGGDAGAG